MVKLKIKVHGEPVTEMSLDESKPFLAGRKEGSDFVLQGDKGISREHFKIIYENGFWELKVLSRFGDVFLKGEKIQEFRLEHGMTFSVAQYEFEFDQNGFSNQNPVTQSAAINKTEIIADDRTMVGSAPSLPFIKMTTSTGEVKSMVRLENGDSWIAGRDAGCQILIDDSRVSRKQFEIRKNAAVFFITDLGSVNGTYLNSSLLTQLEPTPIKSGDAISVLENYFYFELHDPNFKSRLELVKALPPVQSMPSENYDPSASYYNSNQQGQATSGGEFQPLTPHWVGHESPHQGQSQAQSALKKFDYKKYRIHLIVGAIALVFIILNLAPSGNDDPSKKQGTAHDSLSKLTVEQKALVKQSYQLAKNYYMQQRFESARGEISKMKEFVPEYADSENLSKLIEQAIFIQQESVKNERDEKIKEENEAKVQEIVETCRKKLNPKIEASEMDSCLSEAVNLVPFHPKIVDLKNEVAKLVEERTEKENQQKEYQGLVAQLKAIFTKAEKIQKTEGPLETISAYQKVIKAQLPDPNGLKQKAQRMIAAIKSEMDKKSNQFIQEADQLIEQKKLKEAVFALRKAQQVNPTNPNIQDRIDDNINTLKKQMMLFYQEAILEESFGNVDGADNKTGAKEKWKKIIDLDVPDGEYYKKATIKLKKYGAL